MAITFTDIFDVEAEEENGQVVTLVREGRIEGLTSTNPQSYAQEALQSAAVPAAGTIIAVAASALYLRGRKFTADDDTENGSGKITLTYRRGEGGASEPGGTTPTLRGGTTLKQVQTAVDQTGSPIVLSYEWPVDAKQQFDDGSSKAGHIEEQGGTLNVLIPMSSIAGDLIVSTSTPGAITQAYAGHVNSVTWQGGAPRTWLCTSATFELFSEASSPALYRLSFLFEYDERTWDNDTTAVFIDSSTGNPPPDVSIGNGLTQIEWYPEKNFNEDF